MSYESDVLRAVSDLKAIAGNLQEMADSDNICAGGLSSTIDWLDSVREGLSWVEAQIIHKH